LWCLLAIDITHTHIAALLLIEPGRTAPDGLEASAGYHCMWMLLYVHGQHHFHSRSSHRHNFGRAVGRASAFVLIVRDGGAATASDIYTAGGSSSHMAN
jgi:hypothetical protein